jgi:hypothetical protein
MSSSVELWPAISPPLVTTIYANVFTDGVAPMRPGINCIVADQPCTIEFFETETGYVSSPGLGLTPNTPTLINVSSANPWMSVLGFNVYVAFYPVGGDPYKLPYAPMTAPEAVGVYTYNYEEIEVYDLQITSSAEVLLTSSELVYVAFGAEGDDMENWILFPIPGDTPMRFKLTPASTRMAIVGDGGVGTNTMRMAFIGQVL